MGGKRDGLVLAFSVTKKDCIRQTFPAGGPGGQNQNKRDTAVRFIHEPSGARGESREHRTQHQNEKAAWKRMANHPKMMVWISRELYLRGLADKPAVAEPNSIPEKDLKIERRVNGAWEEWK